MAVMPEAVGAAEAAEAAEVEKVAEAAEVEKVAEQRYAAAVWSSSMEQQHEAPVCSSMQQQ
jgi:hypothetical protein